LRRQSSEQQRRALLPFGVFGKIERLSQLTGKCSAFLYLFIFVLSVFLIHAFKNTFCQSYDFKPKVFIQRLSEENKGKHQNV
jgi:hypothetical protein